MDIVNATEYLRLWLKEDLSLEVSRGHSTISVANGVGRTEPAAWLSIYTKSQFSKIFSTSQEDSKSLIFCVMAVGILLVHVITGGAFFPHG